MRQQGRIDTWLDDRGFGFITPERGNQRLFVHIKSFRRGGRRPVVGASVSYLVRRDGAGRLQATQVAFTDTSMAAPASADQLAAVAVAVVAILGVGIATTLGR
jgi:cold shock CspA family protein